jgi:hypothetical protein
LDIFWQAVWNVSIPNFGVYSLVQQSTVPILCQKSLIDLCGLYTFSPQKSDHCMLLFFGSYGNGSGQVDAAMMT